VRSLPVDANHISICKPADHTKDIYVLVREFTTRPVQGAKPLPDAIVEKLLAARIGAAP
jgi:hypothetical protein